jgi:ribosomal protein S19
MTRSLWKGNFIDSFLLWNNNKKKAMIWSRRSTITANLIGQTVFVHNGKEFKRLYITRAKVGFKFGQFIFTRKYTQKYKQGKRIQQVKK